LADFGISKELVNISNSTEIAIGSPNTMGIY